MLYDFPVLADLASDHVRTVLTLAKEEAIQHGHDYLGTEHMLLALTAGGKWAPTLEWMKVEASAARNLTEGSIRAFKARAPSGELPYTSRAKKTLEFAMLEARHLQHSVVEPCHLLLGLLREEKGIAAQVLVSLGVSLDNARAQMLDGRSERDAVVSGGPWGTERDAASRFDFSIDDTSTSSIYEQIIAQVNEAVATGALRPGQRLPTVRRLADELDIAPGTVARAYGELERLGVVQTEGARGTRVAERPRDPQPLEERRETLVGLLRPVAVAAFHLGATATELRQALDRAMDGVLRDDEKKS